MSAPHVYADFNGVWFINGRSAAVLLLTGYGTLASLARQKIRLEEEMKLIFFEPNDIECEGAAHFEMTITDPAGRAGAWVALINWDDVRDCIQQEHVSDYPCIECGNDGAFGCGGNYEEHCPTCGASVMTPMLPPGPRLNMDASRDWVVEA
jgi:hypothetical protein